LFQAKNSYEIGKLRLLKMNEEREVCEGGEYFAPICPKCMKIWNEKADSLTKRWKKDYGH
jgi:hypothetical protein